MEAIAIATRDAIEVVKPRAVIAGHKKPENDDNPRSIEETRQYIYDFDRVAKTSTTARELYDKMLELYPDRVNPGALWLAACGGQTVKWCDQKEFSYAAVTTHGSRRTLRCD